MKPIRLRPHHFLCILTYAGKGYSRRFVRGFDRVIADLKRGRPVMLVSGPDDICNGLEGRRYRRHCFSEDVKQRDRGALADFRARVRDVGRVAPMSPQRARRLRKLYQTGAIRTGCAACGWKKLCDRLIIANFEACQLPGVPARAARTRA